MTASYDPLTDTATFTCGSCGRPSNKKGEEVRRDDDVVIHCECGAHTTFRKSGRLAERRKGLGSEGYHITDVPKLPRPRRAYYLPILLSLPGSTDTHDSPPQPLTKVLIADTDALIVWLLERYLRRSGYQVVGVKDGTQVLDRVRREAPNVVLLDIILPGKSGLEVLRDLQSEFPQMPVIMITGVDFDSGSSKAFQLGAVDYLPKPFELQTVAECLARVLNRSECSGGGVLGNSNSPSAAG